MGFSIQLVCRPCQKSVNGSEAALEPAEAAPKTLSRPADASAADHAVSAVSRLSTQLPRLAPKAGSRLVIEATIGSMMLSNPKSSA
ncbi:hypothetical protein MKK62_14695 [Mycobacterium paraterrae]|uniref:Uncharacterized protein n=1 Tax=Mycobacterium paraterrae TaxID=577492 RepID=A0ABY3VGZ5_9MYCO|nr:hypothetical protein MKK62_14695 [Mycobacterium paraterrae]